MKTDKIILARALELFNERGVEYVGLRELATDLGMRVSNINYYFPTKDDLVDQLSQDLAELNSRTVFPKTDLDVIGFLEMFRQVFINHSQYRCLLLSLVHLMKQNPKTVERYKQTETKRKDTLRSNLEALVRGGDLTIGSNEEYTFLVSALALVVRFWISEATISYAHLTVSEQITHYLNVMSRILLPYSTPKGRAALLRFLNEETTESKA